MLDINSYSYFLFDYDGLLVDSEKLYFDTWSLILNDEGKKVCREFHEGKHESEVYEKVKQHLKRPLSLKEVSDYRKKEFDKLVAQGDLLLVEGIKELLEKLINIAPMSIVSNSKRSVVEKGIESTGIKNYFDSLICYSDDVNRKPDPDLYNLAISALNLNKNSVLALEDSKSGVVSAKKAGVPVICISPHPLMRNYCDKNNVDYYKFANELF